MKSQLRSHAVVAVVAGTSILDVACGISWQHGSLAPGCVSAAYGAQSCRSGVPSPSVSLGGQPSSVTPLQSLSRSSKHVSFLAFLPSVEHVYSGLVLSEPHRYLPPAHTPRPHGWPRPGNVSSVLPSQLLSRPSHSSALAGVALHKLQPLKAQLCTPLQLPYWFSRLQPQLLPLLPAPQVHVPASGTQRWPLGVASQPKPTGHSALSHAALQ